jgi:hypothetical protein
MPSPSSAYDLIRGAMRLINALAPGETPTATEAQDGLAVLNDLLETMSTESLSVWGQANQPFQTVAGQAVYTIGTGGNWDTARPIDITDAFCSLNGIDYPVKPWYLLYMKHAMAVMLAPDYGREVAQAIRDTLNVAKGNISRANIPRRYARFDSALLGNGGGANWQRGY